MQNLSFVDEVKKREQVLGPLENCLGKGAMMPFNVANSSPRKIMYSVQLEQKIELTNPEVPIVQTGYEARFGENSSSYVTTEHNYKIIAKINKFEDFPDHQYILVVYNEDLNEYDIIERVGYKHISEEYGFSYNNSKIDRYKVGDTITKDDVIIKSNSFDEYDNRKDGVNLLTAYLACEFTKDDGIVISEAAKEKLEAPLYHKVEIVINDNDIPLNLYGNDQVYKIFPDINEKINDKILCALRREKKEQALYLQSKDMLTKLIVSDEKFILDGYVVDINVYANNQELLSNSPYLRQIDYYNKNHLRYLRELKNTLQPLKDSGIKCSHQIEKLLYNADMILNGGQYIKENLFSNIIIEFLVYNPNQLRVGDKISNRYGGKGVVSQIRPNDMMPMLDNGETVELIFNPASVINRENVGQLLEISTTYSGNRIMEYLINRTHNTYDAVEMYKKYIKCISPKQGKYIEEYLDSLNVDEQNIYLDSVFSDNGIIVSTEPASECLGVDQLQNLYKEFKDVVHPYKVQVPLRRSDGSVRYVKTRRDLICGRQYIYRLKQHAEEKFSAVSLSSTNLKNENCRNNLDKFYKTTHTKTCVKFGEMETGNLMHLDPEIVVTNLMLYSLSPHGRRLFRNLLVGDPFNIDIKLDEDCSNRTVEIINTYLLTMGLELEFLKKPRVLQTPFIRGELKKPFKQQLGPRRAFVKSEESSPFVRTPQYVEPKSVSPFIKVDKEE